MVRLVRVALAVAVLSSLLLYIATGLARVWSPLPLNDLELAVVAHVRRLSDGLPIYAAPSVRFVALVYMPVFYYVAAMATRLVGEGFVGPRLVSFAASMLSIYFVYRLVALESGSRYAGLVAAGLRAALGADLGWLALARVDALMGCFVLAGLYRIRAARDPRGVFAAGTVFALATLTKQSALLVAMSVAAWQLWADRRSGVLFASGYASVAVLLGGFFQWRSAGWFSFYTVRVAGGQHPGDLLTALQMGTQLLRIVPFAAAVTLVLQLKSVQRRLAIDTVTAAFYLSCTVGVIGSCVMSAWLHGSLTNVLLLPCAWLIVCFVIGLERVDRLARRDGDEALEVTLAAICLTQFVALAYVPSKLVPKDDAVAAGTPIVIISGDVRTAGTVRGSLHASAVDGIEYADGFAVQDLFEGAPPAVKDAFESEVRAAICHATPTRPVVLDRSVAALNDDRVLSPVWDCR